MIEKAVLIAIAVVLSIPMLSHASGEDVPFLVEEIINQLNEIERVVELIHVVEGQLNAIREGELPVGIFGCNADALLKLKGDLQNTYNEGVNLQNQSQYFADNISNWYPNGANGINYAGSGDVKAQEQAVQNAMKAQKDWYNQTEQESGALNTLSGCLANQTKKSKSAAANIADLSAQMAAASKQRAMQLETSQNQLAVAEAKLQQEQQERQNYQNWHNQQMEGLQNVPSAGNSNDPGNCSGLCGGMNSVH